MTLKKRLTNFFKQKVLSPLIDNIEEWEAEVIRRPGSMPGGENSPSRFNIPREGLKRDTDGPPLPGFPKSGPQIFGSITNIHHSVQELKENPKDGKKQMDAETLEAMIAYAKSVGADELGFTPVRQEWVFKETAIAYTQAIVLVMEMDKARMDLAPNRDTAVMVHETYNALGQTSNKLARWLREQGYAAHAGHPLSGMALYPPMAQAAGLGWRGINGLVITPCFGPRVRLAAVFVEIDNLPTYEGDEHAWVLDFCEACKKCVRDCPPDAFYDEPIHHDNGIITVLDNEKCFPYFVDFMGALFA